MERKVKDIEINEKTSVDELVRQMSESGGFSSKHLADGIDILEEMIKDKGCLRLLSFPSAIISTGTRGIIKEMIRNKWFDAIVTASGTLDHDIARSYKDYFHGSFDSDDRDLHQKGLNRIGNVIAPNESYGIIIEEKMLEFLKDILKNGKNEVSTHELCWEIGKRIENEDSILHWCYKNKIPVVVPGITDGAVGYQIWQFSQKNNFKIDLMKDETLLSDLVWSAKKSGALVIGGGISKHHTIWWAQFAKGLDYGVYVTTAQEFDGSLSGARTHEAISWGKIKEKAKHVNINSDATIALPIILAALKERI